MWKLNRNRANLETEVGTPPVRTLSTLDGRTGIQVKVYIYICMYIYILSTVSSRKLKLLYQTAARLCAADFSCNTCLSRDSRCLASARLSRETFVSRVTRHSKFPQKIDLKTWNRGSFPWLEWKWLETVVEDGNEFFVSMFDCFEKRRANKESRNKLQSMESYFIRSIIEAINSKKSHARSIIVIHSDNSSAR